MRRQFIVVLIGLGIAGAAAPVSAAELPPAPTGFTWERLAEINAQVLKPYGWTLKHQKNGDSETYTFSPTSNSTNPPTLSFALNWVPQVPTKTQMPPSKYASVLTDAAAKNHQLEDRTTTKQGSFDVTTFRYSETPPGRAASVLRYQFFANDRSGALVIAAFEAPAQAWDAAWKIGRVITENLRLDETR